MPSFFTRLQSAWNVFTGKDVDPFKQPYSVSYSYRPDRTRFTRGNEKGIITPIFVRIAMDVAAVNFRHVRLDASDRYVEDMDSRLNECLSLSANLDQTSRSFIQDVVMSMFDEGCVAIIPTDTIGNPFNSKSFDVVELRVAKILEWYPERIKVRIYNERTGKFEDKIVPKYMAAIVENPFYAVMNEPNSTLKRLIHKMALLDSVDEQNSSNKLNLIIQLPYVVKSESRRRQAASRTAEMENQLTNSRYGIAYADGTEKIIQLNRSIESQLPEQVKALTEQLYSQLGMTPEIFNGTANEATMLNYMNKTIEPIANAIVGDMNRKFLTKTARSQKQAIKYFSDPFRLVPVNQLAEIADKFTRNEIMTSNEIRQVVGLKPSADPNADVLRNKNVSAASGQVQFDINGQPINNQSNLLQPDPSMMDPNIAGGMDPNMMMQPPMG